MADMSSGQARLMDTLPPKERKAWESVDPFHNSLSDDWMTPPRIIELARAVMGHIDLDPASCDEAQQYIRAKVYYTAEQDGLNRALPWRGNVWLNPPYGRGVESAEHWVKRLAYEYSDGAVTQAITCLNADSVTSQWFDPVWDRATLHMFTRGRISFTTPAGVEGGSPTRGTVFSYWGTELGAKTFKEFFAPALGGHFARHERV